MPIQLHNGEVIEPLPIDLDQEDESMNILIQAVNNLSHDGCCYLGEEWIYKYVGFIYASCLIGISPFQL